MNRRHFLTTAAALPVATRALAFEPVEPVKSVSWVLLGTDKGAGIYRAPWNAVTGEIGAIELHAPCDRPVYFARHPRLPILYVNNELSGGKALLSAFLVATDGIKPLQQVSCDDGPCYVSCDSKHVYSANYAAGSFEAWSLTGAGDIIEPVAAAIRAPKFTHPGTVADRQDNPHFHCAIAAPGGQHVFVCDLGSDRILTIPRDALSTFTATATRPGSGPRHVAVHPNGKWVYCIHELDATIDLFNWHEGKLTPNPLAPISTLAPGTPITGNTGCELLISPDGRFAYACTRGTDDITTYRIDEKTGALMELQRLPSGGKIPRILTFDPTRRWLIACNQADPGKVAVFSHDPATAKLTLAHTYDAPTPMCITWI